MDSNQEQFLVFLKADSYLRKYVGAMVLKKIFENKDFKILAFKEAVLSEEHAKKHYQEHEGKSFFPWLLRFVAIGPVLAMIVKGNIQKFRDMVGSTRCQEADPKSIRGEFGIWGGVNLIHASDGTETAKSELEIWEEEIGLTQEENVNEKIGAYISTWSVKKKNFTKEIRKNCYKLENLIKKEEEIKIKIKNLLKEECYISDEEKVKLFTEIIVEACKL